MTTFTVNIDEQTETGRNVIDFLKKMANVGNDVFIKERHATPERLKKSIFKMSSKGIAKSLK